MQELPWLGATSVVLGNDPASSDLFGLPWPVVLLVFAAAVVGLAWGLSARSNRLLQARRERSQERQAQERMVALRREVYLSAAEAIARAQEFVARLPGADLSRDEARQLSDAVAGALGRVHLVGTEPTLRATMAVANEFAAAHLALGARKRPVVELQNEVESLDLKVRHLSFERDQLLAAITRMAGDGMEQHGALWSEMNLRFDKLHRDIAGLLSRREERAGAMSKAQHEYALEAAQVSLKLAKLAVPAYLALRRDLDMPLDEMEYRSMAQRGVADLERLLRQLSDGPAPAEAPKARATPDAKSEAARPEQPHETRLRMILKKNN